MDTSEPRRASEPLEYRTVHLDWHDDPPRFRPDVHLPRAAPGSPEAADAEAEARVRAALEPLFEAGWEPDGDLWDGLTFERRTRQILLPIPGMPGPRWTELVSAEIRLHRPLRQETVAQR